MHRNREMKISVRLIYVQDKSSGRAAHYKLTSTAMLWLQTTKAGSGTMNLGGSLTRQASTTGSICHPHVGHGGSSAFRPKGHRFESRSSCHSGTLGKSFTRSCLWRFGVKLRHKIRAVSGVPLSSRGLAEAL